MSTVARFKDTITIEQRNRRGWPKNDKQLAWAKLVIVEGRSYISAAREVYGPKVNEHTPGKLARTLRPFLAFLQEQKNVVAEREFDATVERLLRESAAIALSDKLDYLRPVVVKGAVQWIGKPPNALTKMQRIAVREVSQTHIETDFGPEIDFHYYLYGKQAAIEFVGKHLGMTSEKLLVEMISRRNAEKLPDYTNVSTDDLKKAATALTSILESLKDQRAIPAELAAPE